ncbi:MAG: RHS repeat-associated core domain-containing protein [Formivibrio sp.]|nr:RHS repeat-associated core domain-containing protein [Formivibrio sp.]
MNRITNSIFPDGTMIDTIYNALDVIAEQGRDNRFDFNTYDVNRKLVTHEDTAGHLSHYEWCGCGALESITDPKGQMTYWGMDLESRVVQKYYPDLSTETATYYPNSKRIARTTDANGINSVFSYNLDDTLSQLNIGGINIYYGYDSIYNRLTAITNNASTNTFGYVPAGQPGASQIQALTNSSPNATILFKYDALGRPISEQIGPSTNLFQFDVLGRIFWSSNILGTATVQYVGSTTLPATVSEPNGTVTTYGYTPVSDGSRLQMILTTNSLGVLARNDYVYDINNLILIQTNTLGTNTTVWYYSYNLEQELTTAMSYSSSGVHKYSFTYDKAGNRLSEQIDNSTASETPNNANQIAKRTGGGSVYVAGYLNQTGMVSIAGQPAQMYSPMQFGGQMAVGVGTNQFPVSAVNVNGLATTNWYNLGVSAEGVNTTYTYDKAGNVLTESSTSQTNTIGWDYAERCSSISWGLSNTVIAYDAMDHWIRLTEHTGITQTADRRFVWAGDTLLEERDTTGNTVVKRYFPYGFWQQGTNYYYVKDQLGSVIAVTTTNGTIVAEFTYDPYGRRTQIVGTLWVDYGFAGLFEHASGFKLAVHRVYEPTTGRWLSKDPIRENGGWNLYDYCDGNPINGFDMLGLKIYPLNYKGKLGPRDQRGFNDTQYLAIITAIGLEKENGTHITANIIGNTFAWQQHILESFNNDYSSIDHNIMLSAGELDLDWFTDIKAIDTVAETTCTYEVGKSLWTAARYAKSGIMKLLGRQKTIPHYNWPYQDPGEVTALTFARKGMRYSDIFTPQVLRSFYNPQH